MVPKMNPLERLALVSHQLEFVAQSVDRIGAALASAVDRRSAENASTVLRALGGALDAAVAGHPGALEVFAIDASEMLCSRLFNDAMENRSAEAVPVLANTDEQEGE